MESKVLLAPLEWRNEKRKVKDLVPYEFNPRRLTEERKQLLINSIEKFNLAEVPAVNTDNVIIAGHQRVKVLMELGRGEESIDVRVPNRSLTEKEFKEYNLTSNTIWINE
jgi:ParB-like chromosome segregation protein Spo0J